MKQLSVTLLILSFTCFGFAEIKVGDHAYFAGSQVSKCGTSKTNLQRLSQITEVNSSSVKVLVQERYNSNSVASYENILQTADFPDGNMLQD